MKLLIMKSAPLSRYFFPLMPKYRRQGLIIENSQPLFFL